jgi:hypothetical protein
LLSHLRSYERYDEPETLPYSIRPFCPMSADAGQAGVWQDKLGRDVGMIQRGKQ